MVHRTCHPTARRRLERLRFGPVCKLEVFFAVLSRKTGFNGMNSDLKYLTEPWTGSSIPSGKKAVHSRRKTRKICGSGLRKTFFLTILPPIIMRKAVLFNRVVATASLHVHALSRAEAKLRIAVTLRAAIPIRFAVRNTLAGKCVRAVSLGFFAKKPRKTPRGFRWICTVTLRPLLQYL